MASPAPPPVGFPLAWELAVRAGLVRPFATTLPDPAIARLDAKAAWFLARALAEAEGFQRALGQWVDTPAPTSRELAQALAGLRHTGRGPGWWRRLCAPLRALDVVGWQATILAAGQAASAERERVAHARHALAKFQAGLEEWEKWASATLPGEGATVFAARRGMLAATLALLDQRLALREAAAERQVQAIGQAGPLLEAARQARALRKP